MELGETLEPEGNSNTTSRARKILRRILSRQLLVPLCLGQVLSLLISGTAITSGLLAELHVSVPTAQSFLNYVLLTLTFMSWLLIKQGWEVKTILKERAWKYFLIAVVDVEANYLMVKAYQYTTVTSVQLLDVFTIPTVIVLSWVALRVRYGKLHVGGVAVCMAGAAALVVADILVDKNSDQARNKLLGDIFCVAGAVCYGISNVCEEYYCKKFNRIEFLAMLGFFGTFINGVQLVILERHEVAAIDWSSYKIILLLVAFAVCLFLLYATMPVVMVRSSATLVNLSLLSADFYALLVGLVLFKYKFHPLYFVSFVTIVLGLVLYNVRPTTRAPPGTPPFPCCPASCLACCPPADLPLTTPAGENNRRRHLSREEGEEVVVQELKQGMLHDLEASRGVN